MRIKPIINGGIKYICNNDYRFMFNASHGRYKTMDDKRYLSRLYKARFGKEICWENPTTFNEKVQWLKLYDRKLQYITMVDKYLSKQYVANIIGDEYIIPALGVWKDPEDIEFDRLPDQFVLKTNHDCGGIVICKDKSKLDKKEAIKKLKKHMKYDYYSYGREWPYKGVQRVVFAEAYMEDKTTSELRDYKFFCFDGKVKAMFVASDRQAKGKETKFDFFDEHYNHLPLVNGHPNADALPKKPENFEKMKELASKLSKGIPHLRVDFYEVNGKVYFGELTFSHWSGLVPFEPEEWDYTFGSWIKLPPIS